MADDRTGILLFGLSHVLYSSIQALQKDLVATYNPGILLICRFGVAGLISVPFVGVRWTHLWPLVIIAGLTAITSATALVSVALVPLGQAFILFKTAPLMILALAPVILAERPTWLHFSAIIGGFIGVSLTVELQPSWHDAWPLASALTYALCVICTRRLAIDVATFAVACRLNLLTLLFLAPFLGFWAAPAMLDLPKFAVLGALTVLAEWLALAGLARARAVSIAPLEYSIDRLCRDARLHSLGRGADLASHPGRLHDRRQRDLRHVAIYGEGRRMLIVEDGTGLVDAASYISVTDADAYHAGWDEAAWFEMSVAAKEGALRKATVYLDGTYTWVGAIKTTVQALGWPRVHAYDHEGRLLSSTAVPVQVAQAAAYLGLQGATTALQPATAGGAAGVKRKKVASLEIEFFEGGGSALKREFPEVNALLRDFTPGGQAASRAASCDGVD